MKPAGATPPAERRYPKLGDLGQFWEHLDQATDDYDKDMLDALKSNMDNLLIFVKWIAFGVLYRVTNRYYHT